MTKPEYSLDDGGGDASEKNQGEGVGQPGRSSGRLRQIQSAGGKRGRRPSRVDRNAKLERSRQSARECRARKKQKYQLLEETVAAKEKQILRLREKLEQYKNFCQMMDDGEQPTEIRSTLQEDATKEEEEEEEEEDNVPGCSSDKTSQLPAMAGGDSSSDDDFD
ncbi:cAMP-responsive element-binding protein-like 2 [Diadema antillarum]|uniref:cAMP-responsive element-binding protein-like 2 n=1 Tax=Diadema antillarum TaxID=105358 RepID=UPI003A86A87C